MQTSLTWSSRVSTRPRMTTTASSASSAPICGHDLGEHEHLDRRPEVLEDECGHQLAPLGVAADERGDHPPDGADLAVAPEPSRRGVVELLQIGDGALGEPGQRPLDAPQRMVAHVEPEHLLLEGQALGLGELGVGNGDPDVAVPDRTAADAVAVAETLERGEQRRDAGLLLAPALEGAVDDLLEDQTEALAGMAERVEGAGLDERLHRPLVEHHRVDALAEVVEVGERAVRVALGHDALDQALAHVADGGQAEDDASASPSSPASGVNSAADG